MKGAFSLGKILGIKVYIHFTFFFIFFWRAYIAYAEEGMDVYGILFECLVVAGVFLCVLMHEYGHALAARQYGIPTKQITLLPIGGVAQLQRMPQSPRQELWVAIAGPLVNVALALILLPVVLFQFPTNDFFSEAYMFRIADSFTGRMLIVNVVLLLFNLLPAFPMDGGRVLRALLGFRLDFTLATTIAARIGQIMAIGFIIAGYYFNFFLIFIGLFVIFGAEMELRMAKRKYLGFGISLRDLLVTDYTVLNTNETVQEALHKIAENSTEQDFLVEENEEIAGVISRQKIIENLPYGAGNTAIGDVMQTDVATVSANDTLDEVIQNMRAYHTTILPVFDDEEMIGVITLAAIQEEMQKHIPKNKFFRRKTS